MEEDIERKKETKREKKDRKYRERAERYKAKRSEKKRKPRTRRGEQHPPKYHIAIEVMGGDLMLERELKSLAQQIRYCYAENKKALEPVTLYISNYQSIRPHMTDGCDNWDVERRGGSIFEEEREKVFLTADSEHVLEKMSEEAIYIIGGLVDRNRHKGLTEGVARGRGIKTARLPIAENVKMKASSVLGTNHVFSALLEYIRTQSWEEAIKKAIPERKRAM
jgi:tRNA (guanine9-N1)-methyltransferase